MLAYAAQGLAAIRAAARQPGSRVPRRSATGRSPDLRAFLTRFVEQLNVESTAPYPAFMAVLERDARDAQAAVRLVLAQPAISSQLVDNLNASIHLRALLTDLFLIDEVLKTHQRRIAGQRRH